MTLSIRCLSSFLSMGFALSLICPFSSSASGTATNRFGFTGPEIFPIDNQISELRVADLDGDGLNDLIVVNNARSRINLLYNQTGKTNQASKTKFTGRREIND